ncbi:uncharacterized protein LOC131935459 [Physella acuta]|uniref:uncharacterized protein LOC131935459 n=1 Tax=Physella acuta TaxID=109671 RepID=UPI0027DCC197|nr:uncharacterized protein LOC131935459 [Physella acuta]
MQNIVERWNKTRLPWHYYREEKYRLSTFCTYPSSCTKCAAELASDGFVYTGSGSNNDDSVTCYFCRVTKGGWNFLDIVRDVHAAISPGCCMVTGVNCGNVPFITCSLSAQSLLNAAAVISLQEVTPGFGDPTQNNLPSLETRGTVATTSHQTQNGVLITNSIQSSLIGTSIPVSTNSSRLTSNTTLRAVTSNDTATTVTSTHSSQSAISTQSAVTQSTVAQSTVTQLNVTQSTITQSAVTQSTLTQSTVAQSTVTQSTQPLINTPASTALNNTEHSATEVVPAITTPTNQATGVVDHAPTRRKKPGGAAPTFRDLAIITERPKRIEYALKIKRLETFENWPRGHHLSIDELASAGFYYAGYGDCARCFFCGGGLRNWEDEDDVWVEHARWFPKAADTLYVGRPNFFI